jgi:hypothetical protein
MHPFCFIWHSLTHKQGHNLSLSLSHMKQLKNQHKISASLPLTLTHLLYFFPQSIMSGYEKWWASWWWSRRGRGDTWQESFALWAGCLQEKLSRLKQKWQTSLSPDIFIFTDQTSHFIKKSSKKKSCHWIIQIINVIVATKLAIGWPCRLATSFTLGVIKYI